MPTRRRATPSSRRRGCWRRARVAAAAAGTARTATSTARRRRGGAMHCRECRCCCARRSAPPAAVAHRRRRPQARTARGRRGAACFGAALTRRAAVPVAQPPPPLRLLAQQPCQRLTLQSSRWTCSFSTPAPDSCYVRRRHTTVRCGRALADSAPCCPHSCPPRLTPGAASLHLHTAYDEVLARGRDVAVVPLAPRAQPSPAALLADDVACGLATLGVDATCVLAQLAAPEAAGAIAR